MLHGFASSVAAAERKRMNMENFSRGRKSPTLCVRLLLSCFRIDPSAAGRPKVAKVTVTVGASRRHCTVKGAALAGYTQDTFSLRVITLEYRAT